MNISDDTIKLLQGRNHIRHFGERIALHMCGDEMISIWFKMRDGSWKKQSSEESPRR